MKADYPIKIVKGNYFAIAQPLEKITWENVTKQKVDYIPDVGDEITVTFVGNYNKYDVVNVTIDGNRLLYTCNGVLSIGTYGIEIKVTCADSKKLRSFQKDRIQIVDSNEEAGIPSGDEFDIDTIELDSAVFLYEKGDRGYSAYEIAVQQGFEGTEEEWLESLKGADGTMVFEDLTPAQKASLKGDDGKSAYELAVENGYEGTEEEWLVSLNGEDGDDGKSAYQVYLDTVPEGETPMTETQWLTSLKGEKGDKGVQGDTLVVDGANTYKLYHELGQNTDGAVEQKVLTDALNGLFVPVTSEEVASMADPS